MKRNFPPQTGPYLVKVKTGQSKDRWSDFLAARCQISVGQEYHEGAKLAAMIDWCAGRFETVQICVNDTLQRFNLMFLEELSEQEAIAHSRLAGDHWIRRNGSLWGNHQNVSIVRWDQWLDESLPPNKRKTEFLFASNPVFKQSIQDNIMAIWNRRKKELPEAYPIERFGRFFELSKQYLIEEISVFSQMYETKQAIDIYPGTTLFAATLFQGQDVENAPSGLGKGYFCRIDFSKNKNSQPAPIVPLLGELSLE